MHSKRFLPLALLSASLLLAGAGAYWIASSTDGAGVTEAQSPDQPTREELDRAYTEALERVETDRAKPRFLGAIGSFEIVSDEAEARPTNLCSGGIKDPGPDARPSELNQDDMREQAVCSNDEVVATYSEAGRVSYFSGLAKINVAAPRDNLELTEVNGHEALVVKPLGGVGSYFAFAIVRASSEAEHGVLVSASQPSLELVLETLTDLMAGR